VISGLMRTWGKNEWIQSLQEFMSLHGDMGRAVSPARLESARESAVVHQFNGARDQIRTGARSQPPAAPTGRSLIGRTHGLAAASPFRLQHVATLEFIAVYDVYGA
jgi:hypothetical protein